jgi:hypothetical protein
MASSGSSSNNDYNTFAAIANSNNFMGIDLTQPILPNQKISISFDFANTQGAGFSILGLLYPCEHIVSPPSCTGSNACYAGSSFDINCIEQGQVFINQSIPPPTITPDPVFAFSYNWPSNSIDWQPYQIVWENQSSEPIDYNQNQLF